MNKADFEKKLTVLPIFEPDSTDKAAIKRIAKTKGQGTKTHIALKNEIECSGRVSLRLPKSLHRELIAEASSEGVSLNQFLVYKLSH